jgi:hypothetical protein
VVGWGEIEIKAKLSPAEAGVWAELCKKSQNMHSVHKPPTTTFLGLANYVALALFN